MILLKDLDATARLGKWLAKNLPIFGCPPLFLRGDLGSGKTTLARHIVSNFRNSRFADFASPSFTIYNIYPTEPQILHCDLYRCHSSIPEEILDALDCGNMQILMEWAEFFPKQLLPKEYLDIFFKLDNDLRALTITPAGEMATRLVNALAAEANGSSV